MSVLKRLEEITVQKPDDRLDFKSITPAAEKHGIDPYFLQAVVMQEANGEGFSDEGKATINFEGHWFSKLTAGQYDKTYRSISFPKFRMPKRGEDHPYNATQSQRWGLLLFAASLDFEAAIQATSFGLFQIMGFNYVQCGCDSPLQLVESMHVSEQRQFQLFLTFVKNYDCLEPLQKADPLAFAIRYNTGKNWRIRENYLNPSAEAKRYAMQLRVKYDNLKPRRIS